MSTEYKYTDDSGDTIEIETSESRDNYAYVETDDCAVHVPKAEAVRAAAALLRAAGWGEPTPFDTSTDPAYADENSVRGALGYLDAVIAKQDRQAAKEADKLKLRQEAATLYEAGRAFVVKKGVAGAPPFGLSGDVNIEHWESIAAAARNIHKKS